MEYLLVCKNEKREKNEKRYSNRFILLFYYSFILLIYINV